MNYWLHRISHHGDIAYPLFLEGYLTIGFSDFANQEFIDDLLNVKDDNLAWTQFEEHIFEKWKYKPRTRYSLWRFVHEFKKGDTVLVPGWREFYLYKIVSERPQLISELPDEVLPKANLESLQKVGGLLLKEGETIDLGFFWRVEPILENGVSRNDYADAALTARMKIRGTNSKISDLEESIKKSQDHAERQVPIHLYSILSDEYNMDLLGIIKKEMNPDKFEKLIHWYFQRVGATDVWIPAKNERNKEGDADVIAVFEPIKTIIYVQAKFYNGETGTHSIDQIASYLAHKEKQEKTEEEFSSKEYSHITWVITTGTFKEQEILRFAEENDVKLFDGMQFSQMLLDAGFQGLGKAT
jgi:hypothetical protein